ncbi:uncharacterized protein CLUP02_17089 [Colletotrichum lupini]|uniref:Uncharacterized protein n=1 Tax=Colletotrichum lupini TaxID=145971 RepID=A0A9Q8WPU3_9PEZI|nr:uncharacterized protein CLUP02_17089 [Colletotrichum lupini]UQC91553.1 hypothetical protein CLUP02_17089 [Colletotrichum lupini]
MAVLTGNALEQSSSHRLTRQESRLGTGLRDERDETHSRGTMAALREKRKRRSGIGPGWTLKRGPLRLSVDRPGSVPHLLVRSMVERVPGSQLQDARPTPPCPWHFVPGTCLAWTLQSVARTEAASLIGGQQTQGKPLASEGVLASCGLMSAEPGVRTMLNSPGSDGGVEDSNVKIASGVDSRCFLFFSSRAYYSVLRTPGTLHAGMFPSAYLLLLAFSAAAGDELPSLHQWMFLHDLKPKKQAPSNASLVLLITSFLNMGVPVPACATNGRYSCVPSCLACTCLGCLDGTESALTGLGRKQLFLSLPSSSTQLDEIPTPPPPSSSVFDPQCLGLPVRIHHQNKPSVSSPRRLWTRGAKKEHGRTPENAHDTAPNSILLIDASFNINDHNNRHSRLDSALLASRRKRKHLPILKSLVNLERHGYGCLCTKPLQLDSLAYLPHQIASSQSPKVYRPGLLRHELALPSNHTLPVSETSLASPASFDQQRSQDPFRAVAVFTCALVTKIPPKVIRPPLKESRPALVPSIAWPPHASRRFASPSSHTYHIRKSLPLATTSVYPPRTSWPSGSLTVSLALDLVPQGVALAETGVGCVPHLNTWLGTPCRSITLLVGAGLYSSFQVTSASPAVTVEHRPASTRFSSSKTDALLLLPGKHFSTIYEGRVDQIIKRPGAH